MTQTRSAGILLHLTSLPSRFGIGDMGPTAHEFVDFLREAGQSVWQILPLCPTAKGNSPYSSYSAFAGNVLLLSPERLSEDGWLSDSNFAVGERDANKVDFASATQFKRDLLRTAFAESSSKLSSNLAFKKFCHEEAWWLDDFAHFESLRELTGESDWRKWPLRYGETSQNPEPHQLKNEIEFSKFKQFLFESQWNELKTYANQNGISICGDMPIFVAHESADVWANQSQFLLDANGDPIAVAGVPPDYFSETGQLWGNPLYDWPAMEADGYRWWVDRFRRALNQFDLLRVDHFRGFDQYWKIPAAAETAAEGCWEAGPRAKPFLAAEQELGSLPIWAEDLGDIDQGVHDLRDQLRFPTMRVLQFGYASEDDDFHRHTAFPQHCIGYTGTHDNDTLVSWLNTRQPNEQMDVLNQFLDPSIDESIHFQLINLLYHSNAAVAIVPIQDALGLGNEARMNVPGTAEGNWAWRVSANSITPELAKQLRIMTVVSERVTENL